MGQWLGLQKVASKFLNTKSTRAKIGKLKIVQSWGLASNPSSVTVTKDSANRCFSSFVVDTMPEIWPQSDNSVGIDLGIDTFATVMFWV